VFVVVVGGFGYRLLGMRDWFGNEGRQRIIWDYFERRMLELGGKKIVVGTGEVVVGVVVVVVVGGGGGWVLQVNTPPHHRGLLLVAPVFYHLDEN
jgi:hypothetical protein